MTRISIRLTLLVFALLALASGAFAYNTELEWKTISTEHFDVHYHEGAEWTAQQVAQIAEEVYPHITGLYNYEPKRNHFVILDTQDYANGSAYFYDDKIEIWATNLEFGYRGTTEWLRNVVTHEFTHVVSIQAAMKMPKRIPAFYFQAIGFETEKRPDVITGYPDLIGSYPITGFITPPWWAEGVAQFQSPTRRYDCWDTHRDMILRSSLISDEMISYEEMGFLGHRSSGNEKVYDHGYGLVRYIASAYGADAIRDISESLGKWNRLTIDGALKDVTGKKGPELYDDWKDYLRARYDRQLAPVYANEREGWILNDNGFMVTMPSFSPDGQRVAFLSNNNRDFSLTDLYVANADGKDVKRIRGAVTSRGVFSPDGKSLLFATHRRSDKWGAMKSDLFIYDFDKEKSRRLTISQRLSEPQFSPDGNQIVSVHNSDGTHAIRVMDVDGENMRAIFKGDKGTQFYAPQFSPDGGRILFGVFIKGTRDIASIAADGGDFRYELRTANDERDARWSKDGDSILFASDRSGIFNLYSMSLADSSVAQLTNVTGGAFMPDASPDGKIVYSGYNGEGYNVSVLDAHPQPVAALSLDQYAVRTAGEFDECTEIKGDMADADNVPGTSPGERAFDEGSVASAAPGGAGATPQTDESLIGVDAPTPYEPQKYKSSYTDFQLYPRLIIWDGVPRLGAFLATTEILEKQEIFLAGSYGTDGGFDFLVDLQMRHFFPVFYLQYFRMRQMYADQVDIDSRYYFLDYRYDLWAADFGMRLEFEDRYSLIHQHDLSFWFSHSEYRVHIDPEYVDLADPDAGKIPDQSAGWPYYRGNEFFAEYRAKSIRPALDSNINPRGGRQLRVRFMMAFDELFDTGEFEYGLNPKFGEYTFGQYQVDYQEYLALPWWRHSLQVRLYGSYIDNNVDDFFWVYMGGMDGLRGYTFYALGGRAGALASATYRFPILRRVNRQLSFLTIKDIYGAAFFEAGNAWDDEGFETSGYKRSAGYELRLNLGSFYAYPTAVQFVGAYAIDHAEYVDPLFEENSVVYIPQWRYYWTIGFFF